MTGFFNFAAEVVAKAGIAIMTIIAAVTLAPGETLATPQKWYCGCTVDPDEVYTTCECPGPYEYNIARSGTKTFRPKCTFHSNNKSVVRVLPKLVVIEKDKHVTCTVSVYPVQMNGYGSKSCTNWGALKRNSVKFKMVCGLCGSRNGDECPPDMTNF
ncbi:MAG: hypothetical protein ACE363_07420 [Alphaproteobacteria bacterium]